jgi:hypothetical protein
MRPRRTSIWMGQIWCSPTRLIGPRTCGWFVAAISTSRGPEGPSREARRGQHRIRTSARLPVARARDPRRIREG